jgi:hypothetical protein
MAAAMDFGCHLPVFGPMAARDNLLAFARLAEALGYDSLWVSDHVVVPTAIASRYPYNASGRLFIAADAALIEPLTALTFVAAVTERVRLGTSVLVLPHRHPLLAAKMLVCLDHLSGGRVVVGAGHRLDARGDRDAGRALRAPRRLVGRGDRSHALDRPFVWQYSPSRNGGSEDRWRGWPARWRSSPGSGSGQGRAAAILFAGDDARVVVSDVNVTGGEETVRLVRAAGGEATFHRARTRAARPGSAST